MERYIEKMSTHKVLYDKNKNPNIIEKRQKAANRRRWRGCEKIRKNELARESKIARRMSQKTKEQFKEHNSEAQRRRSQRLKYNSSKQLKLFNRPARPHLWISFIEDDKRHTNTVWIRK